MLVIRTDALRPGTGCRCVVGNVPARPPEEPNPELQHYEIRRQLSLDANPFLNDHRIGEHPVLPATCAATWVASACEQLYPAHTLLLDRKLQGAQRDRL